MREGILGMSASERDRASLVRRHVEEGLSQREASERLGIGVRQFKRLVRDWRREGDAGMMSRQRGRPSNNRLAPDRRAEITALLCRGRSSALLCGQHAGRRGPHLDLRAQRRHSAVYAGAGRQGLEGRPAERSASTGRFECQRGQDHMRSGRRSPRAAVCRLRRSSRRLKAAILYPVTVPVVVPSPGGSGGVARATTLPIARSARQASIP